MTDSAKVIATMRNLGMPVSNVPPKNIDIMYGISVKTTMLTTQVKNLISEDATLQSEIDEIKNNYNHNFLLMGA